MSHVSKDVVYDLLPGYFAHDISDDSRALVDEWLRTDPEFGAMAERFKRLMSQREARRPGDDAARVEAETLARARTAMRRQGEFRGLAIAYALATILVLAAGASGYRQGRAYTIAAVFGVTAIVCVAAARYTRSHPEWFDESRFW